MRSSFVQIRLVLWSILWPVDPDAIAGPTHGEYQLLPDSLASVDPSGQLIDHRLLGLIRLRSTR